MVNPISSVAWESKLYVWSNAVDFVSIILDMAEAKEDLKKIRHKGVTPSPVDANAPSARVPVISGGTVVNDSIDWYWYGNQDTSYRRSPAFEEGGSREVSKDKTNCPCPGTYNSF